MKNYKLFTLALLFMAAFLFGSEDLNAQVFFTEDFEGTMDPGTGMPVGWGETGVSTDGIWYVGTDVEANAAGYWPVPAHTMFAQTNDDVCNCDKSADRLILPTQDFSPYVTGGILLNADFFMDGGFYGGEISTVEVSTDGGATWTAVFSIPAGGFGTTAWADVTQVVLDAYMGMSNITISFLYNDIGNWGSGLAIDNVQLEATATSNLAEDVGIDGLDINKFSFVPLMAAAPVSFGNLPVYNIGGAVASDAVVTVDIYRLPDLVTPEYTVASSPTVVPGGIGLSGIATIGGAWTPADTGSYLAEYTVSSASISDIDAANDAVSYNFSVLDSTYARDDGTPTSLIGIGLGGTATFGNNYDIGTTSRLTSVFFAAGLVPGDTTAVSVWNTDPTGAPTTNVAFYEYVIQDSGPVFIYDIPGGGIDLMPGTYMVGIDEYSSVDNMGIYMTDNYFSLMTSWGSINGGAFSPMEGSPFPKPFLVRPIFNYCLTLASNPTVSDENCGNADGMVDLVPSGGAGGPYTATWASWGAGLNLTGLAAGSDTVTVTDAGGCTVTEVVTVAGSPDPIATATAVVQDDCTDGSGVATVTGTGGTGTYSYLWDANAGNQTTASAVGLVMGTYVVTITDGNGCTASSNVEIVSPATPLTAAPSHTDEFCGQGNGTATITPSGGNAGGYGVVWGNMETTNTIVGLSMGTYTVTVSDMMGCTYTESVTLGEIPAPVLTVIVDSDDICGDGVGQLTAAATGGTGNLAYLWDNTVPNATYSGLAAGSYNVTVTDDVGCTSSSVGSINLVAGPTATAVAADVTVCGGTDGSVAATGLGGTGILSYLWDTPLADITPTVAGLPAGPYNVVVTDDNGCMANATANVGSAGAPTIAISATTDENCGQGNGAIDITVSGASGSETYSWNTPGGDVTPNVSGLPAGTWSVTINDAGCIASQSATIANIAGPTISISSFDPSYCGNDNGSAISLATGGDMNYTYTWDDPAMTTTADVMNLAPGSYNVGVMDGDGCMATTSVTINEIAGPTVVLGAVSDELCGTMNGSVTVIPSGGTGLLTYDWGLTPPQNVANPSGLAAGTYPVVITDVNGCTATTSGDVGVIEGPTSTVSVVSEDFCAGMVGELSAMGVDGAGGYSYSWNTVPVQTTSIISGLDGGTYDVTITDANGCETTNSGTITTIDGPSVSISDLSAETCGMMNGTATALGADGTAPLSYSWNTVPVQTTEMATGLETGDYTVVVTDDNGCTASQLVSIVTVDGPSVSISSSTDVSCFGAGDGDAEALGADGTGALTYVWNTTPPQNTASIMDLGPGTYSVTVTDENLCESVANIEIVEPDDLQTAITPTDEDLDVGAATGEADVTVVGGTGPYSFEWNSTPPQFTQIATGLVAGDYDVTVTDANGCTISDMVTINQMVGNRPVFADKNIEVYPNPNSGIFKLDLNLGTSEDILVQVFNKVGQLVHTEAHTGVTTAVYDMNIDGLSSGIYYVKVSSSNFEVSKKIIVRK